MVTCFLIQITNKHKNNVYYYTYKQRTIRLVSDTDQISGKDLVIFSRLMLQAGSAHKALV